MHVSHIISLSTRAPGFVEILLLLAEPVRRTTQYASPDFTVVPDRINFPYLQSAWLTPPNYD